MMQKSVNIDMANTSDTLALAEITFCVLDMNRSTCAIFVVKKKRKCCVHVTVIS